jgi:crotonobetainyl-CoA:carnitine CoA-transferase CaiB-like acyl-CoA transferase
MRPLEGIRVLELGLAVAGPLAGHVLGDMGADVIKVEAPFSRPKKPSEFVPAELGETPDPWNRMSKFNELNRSKRSLVLDLSHADGKAVFLSLVEKSHIVLENYSSRVMGQLGLGYEVLRERNPGIILVSMPGFGKDGPYANRVCYGPGIDAMSGVAYLGGYMGGGPMKPGAHYCDQNAGVLAAFGAMAAIRHQRRTGEGQHVELAMLEGGLQSVGEALISASVGSIVPSRLGNRSLTMAPHGVFKCEGEDSWVAIAVRNDGEWARLMDILEVPELANDASLATAEGRLADQDRIEQVLSSWCAPQTAVRVEARLQRAGIAAGAVLHPSQVLTDAHLVHRGAHPYVDHPSMGASPVPAVSWHFGMDPAPPIVPAPRFGGDNDEVLGGLLGLTQEAIDKLREGRTVVDEPFRGG